jgi:hypothetical protein
MVGPGDHRLSALERLAQRVENLRVELGQLVEKEHAEMGECHFARTRARAAADERRHARRMMRRAEGAHPADAPASEIAGEAPDHADFEHLGRLERRQDRGEPPRQHRFAGAWRTDHEEMVTAGGGELDRALRRLLALDVLQIGHRLVAGIGRGLGPPQDLQSLEVVDELKQVLRGEDAHVGRGPGGLGPARRGADQALAESVGADCRGKGPGDWRNRAVERQFSEHAEALDGIAGDGPGRGHQPECYGQVGMASLLGQVGGREIDGDRKNN